MSRLWYPPTGTARQDVTGGTIGDALALAWGHAVVGVEIDIHLNGWELRLRRLGQEWSVFPWRCVAMVMREAPNGD